MHDFLDFLKSQGQNGFHSPEQKDAALNAASRDKHAEERRAFESTQHISDNLRKFKTSAVITCVDGLGDLPANYDYATNAETNNSNPDQEGSILADTPLSLIYIFDSPVLAGEYITDVILNGSGLGMDNDGLGNVSEFSVSVYLIKTNGDQVLYETYNSLGLASGFSVNLFFVFEGEQPAPVIFDYAIAGIFLEISATTTANYIFGITEP